MRLNRPFLFRSPWAPALSTTTPPSDLPPQHHPQNVSGTLHPRSTHIKAMLTYPDREKFAQIRAQWELAQPLSNNPRAMVDHKERPTGHAPSTSDTPNAGSSKFRRKLSYGLSFISNTQRRTTPGRQALGTPLNLHNNTHSQMDPVKGLEWRTGALTPVPSPPNGPSPLHRPSPGQTVGTESEKHMTAPNPLPRSLTMSFIPRPIKDECDTPDMKMASISRNDPPTSASTPGPPARVPPTKIPTPSPPRDDMQRHISPRQYVRQYSTQQQKHIAAGAAFAGASSQSPSKASVRSYTAPNLHKGYKSAQPAFMVPRKATVNTRPAGSSPGKLSS